MVLDLLSRCHCSWFKHHKQTFPNYWHQAFSKHKVSIHFPFTQPRQNNPKRFFQFFIFKYLFFFNCLPDVVHIHIIISLNKILNRIINRKFPRNTSTSTSRTINHFKYFFTTLTLLLSDIHFYNTLFAIVCPHGNTKGYLRLRL